MADINGAESPSESSHEAIKADIKSKLNALKNTVSFGKDSAKKIDNVLSKINGIKPEMMRNLQQQVEELGKLYSTNPGVFTTMLTSLERMVMDTGTFPSPGSKEAGMQLPPGMEGMQGYVDKFTTMMKGFEQQFSMFGSGTLKMLEGMFEQGTLLGRIFGFLKNTVAAVQVCVVKTLQENDKTLENPVEAAAIAKELLRQCNDFMKKGWTFEDGSRLEIVDYVTMIMGSDAIQSATTVTKDMFVEAKTWMMTVLKPKPDPAAAAATPATGATATTPAAPAAPAAAAPDAPAVAEKVDSTPQRIDLKDNPLTIKHDSTKGFILESGPTTKKLGQIDKKDVTSLETKTEKDVDASTIIVTLADNKKITFGAKTLRDAIIANTDSQQLLGKQDADTTDKIFEVGFSTPA